MIHRRGNQLSEVSIIPVPNPGVKHGNQAVTFTDIAGSVPTVAVVFTATLESFNAEGSTVCMWVRI